MGTDFPGGAGCILPLLILVLLSAGAVRLFSVIFGCGVSIGRSAGALTLPNGSEFVAAFSAKACALAPGKAGNNAAIAGAIFPCSFRLTSDGAELPVGGLISGCAANSAAATVTACGSVTTAGFTNANGTALVSALAGSSIGSEMASTGTDNPGGNNATGSGKDAVGTAGGADVTVSFGDAALTGSNDKFGVMRNPGNAGRGKSATAFTSTGRGNPLPGLFSAVFTFGETDTGTVSIAFCVSADTLAFCGAFGLIVVRFVIGGFVIGSSGGKLENVAAFSGSLLMGAGKALTVCTDGPPLCAIKAANKAARPGSPGGAAVVPATGGPA